MGEGQARGEATGVVLKTEPPNPLKGALGPDSRNGIIGFERIPKSFYQIFRGLKEILTKNLAEVEKQNRISKLIFYLTFEFYILVTSKK